MPLLHIVYPAFKSILVNRLQKILYCYKKPDLFAGAANYPDFPTIFSSRTETTKEIPLNRVQRNDQIWYVSAIAFRLTDFRQTSATDIAAQLADALNQSTVSTNASLAPLPLDRVWRGIEVQSASPGWIHFKINEIGLADWLQILSEWLLDFDRSESRSVTSNAALPLSSTRNSTRVFEVLYTHARCCALLRLGQEAGILRLHQDSTHPSIWHITHPDPIPWCADRTFRCRQVAEYGLIIQLISVLDELSSSSAFSADQIWRLTHRLSQDFQAFYAHCSIFAIAKTDRELAQARLGLVLITQALLRWMLHNWLSLEPPIEL